MNVEMAVLCEGASIKSGQVCILHTFANWHSPSIPTTVRGVLVAQVRFMDHENGDHRMHWEMVNADGKLVWKSEWAVGSITLRGKMGSQGWPQTWVMEAECEPGQHELILKLDEEPIASLLLAVLHVVPTPTQ